MSNWSWWVSAGPDFAKNQGWIFLKITKFEKDCVSQNFAFWNTFFLLDFGDISVFFLENGFVKTLLWDSNSLPLSRGEFSAYLGQNECCAGLNLKKIQPSKFQENKHVSECQILRQNHPWFFAKPRPTAKSFARFVPLLICFANSFRHQNRSQNSFERLWRKFWRKNEYGQNESPERTFNLRLIHVQDRILKGRGQLKIGEKPLHVFWTYSNF